MAESCAMLASGSITLQGYIAMASRWAKAIRTKIENRDQMICCYCGTSCVKYTDRANNYHYATLDHIVARWEIAKACNSAAEYESKITDPKTLVLVCNACNSSKQHTPLYIWCNKKGYSYSKIIAEIARRTMITID